MNNPNNPFVPKGSLLDLQGRRRSQLKIAVFCVVAVGAVSLSAMLIQGCERKKPADENAFGVDNLGATTNLALTVETNFPPLPTNNFATPPPVESNTIANPLTPVDSMTPLIGGSDYKILKGDTLDKIAKHYGVSTKALQNANPKLDPKRLKIGDKVVIPPATPKAAATSATSGSTDGKYVVKPGDSLGKIAKAHGTTVSALKAVNSLATDRINAGQKLTIPDKSVAAPVTPAPAATPDPFAAPPAAPVTEPAPVK